MNSLQNEHLSGLLGHLLKDNIIDGLEPAVELLGCLDNSLQALVQTQMELLKVADRQAAATERVAIELKELVQKVDTIAAGVWEQT